jgi:hypothetical protein
MKMAFWKVKGVQVVSGIGHLFAVNTATGYPTFEYVETFKNPTIVPTAVASGNLVTTVASPSGAGGLDLTLVTAVELLLRTIPRNVAIVASAAETTTALVTGFDQFGTAQTETVTFNGATVVEGTKVWGAITTIHAAQRSGTATIAVGFGSIFGTSRKIIGISIDGATYTTSAGVETGVQETTRPVKTTTAGVHGVTFTTAIAATKTYDLIYHSDEAR